MQSNRQAHNLEASNTVNGFTPTTLDVVLPAGGRISGDFATEAGTDTKALISLNGKTLLRRVIETLQESGHAGRVVVVGPENTLAEAKDCGADGTLQEGASGPDNIYRGLEWLQSQKGASRHALVVTTDLPFLTPDVLSDFIRSCPPDADVALPLVTEHAFRRRFPDSPSVFVRLRDGSFTMGCVFRLCPITLMRNRTHLDRIFEARKSEWAMGKLLGARFVWKYATRQLTIRDIETRCQQILQCVGTAVPDSPAELAYDIDIYEEYAHARRCTG